MAALICRIIHVQLFADTMAVHSCTQGAAEHWKSVKLIASRSLLQTVLVAFSLGERTWLKAVQGVWVQGEEHNPF